jgi:hypothetical protein
VRKLDARDNPLGADEPGDPGQWFDVVVVPDPKIAG